MTMTSFADIAMPLSVANDDTPFAGVVPAHIAKRRMEQRIMLGVAVLASLTLVAVILQGHAALQTLPDLVTFAARV